MALLTTPTFLIFVFASGAVQAGHAVFYTFGTLHWSALGISPRIAGLLWTVGVGAEILLFATAGALLRRTGPIAMLALAAGAGIVRWGAMACEPAVWLLFGLQALHGLTFGATHIGAIHFLASALPQHQAGTAQAVYAAVTSGILLGGTTMLVGPLYADWGGRAYWAMAAVSAVGLIATMLLKKVVAGRDPTG
jgi:PPP family 3-phenylpropionic acid transporter